MLGLSCDSPVPPILANINEITSKRCLPYFIAQWSDGTKRRDIMAKIDSDATPFLVPTMIIQWTNCMKILETFDRGVALLTSLCQRKAARFFSFCSAFCGYLWSLSCMVMHGRIREGKTGWFLLVEYHSWLASYIKSRISYLQFFSGPQWFLRFTQRLLTQKLPWQSWFLSFCFQGFVSMHLYDYSVNLIG